MRFIPTSDITVERIKNRAKSLKNKQGGKHAECLDRAAQMAGYVHWHHLLECHKATKRFGTTSFSNECFSVMEAARKGICKCVVTGSDTSTHVWFVLFSTYDGDAWALEPQEQLYLKLMDAGIDTETRFCEDETRIYADWEGEYEYNPNGLIFLSENPDGSIHRVLKAGVPYMDIPPVIENVKRNRPA